MNSIGNSIQFIHEIENDGALPFLDTLVSLTDEGFSTSVYRKNFAAFLFLHACFCDHPSQKMAEFHTFVNCVLNICSGPINFNTENQYLKEIALDRDYYPPIVVKGLFKLQNPCLSHPSHSNINIISFFFFQI